MNNDELNSIYLLVGISVGMFAYVGVVGAICYYKSPKFLYKIINGGDDMPRKPFEELKPNQSPNDPKGSLDDRL